MDALLDFRMEVTLDGEKLSAAEIKRLLAHSDGLALIRGKWVEVDHKRLSRTLEQFEAIERRAATDGLSFAEAMRMLAGVGIAGDGTAGQADVAWIPMGYRVSTRVDSLRARCDPINRSGCSGFICLHNSGLGLALPTTWGSARPSRSCRYCWC
jgi:hypothetical protein